MPVNFAHWHAIASKHHPLMAATTFTLYNRPCAAMRASGICPAFGQTTVRSISAHPLGRSVH